MNRAFYKFCEFYIFVISTGFKFFSSIPVSIALYKAQAVSNDVKHGILHSTAILLILKPSLFDCFPLVGVLITKLIFPNSIRSIILFLPSHSFSITIDSTPFSFKYLAVPEVA